MMELLVTAAFIVGLSLAGGVMAFLAGFFLYYWLGGILGCFRRKGKA